MKTKFNKMNFFISAMLFLALIVGMATPTQTARAANTLNVDNITGGCNDTTGTPYYCTIQAAINAAVTGDTINVAAGTYTEQLTITKSLHLIGAGAGLSIIAAPGTLPVASIATSAIVLISGSGVDAELTGFTVTGPGPSACGSIGKGVYVYGSANANIHDNTIQDIRDSAFSGCQNGMAIMVGRQADSTTGTATIDHNTIISYQKGGIMVDNTGSSATITNNTMTGAGTTAVIAQNGIQVSRGATATLSGNTVTGNSFHLVGNPSDWGAAGILIYDAGAVTMSGGNTASGNDQNLYISSATAVTLGAEILGPSSAPVDSGYDVVNYSSLALDLTGVTFVGSANNFDIEDRIWHGVDDATLGLATWVAGNLYVTPSSGTDAIQRAFDAASPCDTINVDAGTYDVDTTIILNKCVTISGPGGGGAILQGTTVSAVSVFEITASSVTIQNLDITISSIFPAYPTDEVLSSLIRIPNGLGLTGIAITGNNLYVPAQAGAMSTWVARALTVGDGGSAGIAISGNTMHNTRNGVVIRSNDTATITNNIIYNTKGGIMNYTSNQADADNRMMSNNSWTTAHNEWDIVWNSMAYYTPDYQVSVLALSGANNGAYVLDLRAADEASMLALTGNRSHIFVNATTGTLTKHRSNGNMNLPYKTIALGIEAVVPGGTVYVAAGTYNEQVTIPKPLTLTGSDGAVLDGTGLAPTWTTGVKIKSGNVTFNNIDVTNFTQDGIIVGYEASVPGNLQNVHITNSKISNIQPGYWGFGIYVGYESEGFGYIPPKLTTHLDYSGLLIEGNEITNVHSSALVIQSLTGTPGSLVVRNNNIHDNTTNSGIWVDCARNLLIENNTVVGNKWGVEFSCYAETGGTLNGPYSPKDITLRGNLISTNTFEGIALYEAWPGTFTITGNRIQGNGSGINNPLATTLNAANNWWGAASGPGPVGPGTGDTVSANVDFSPWCVNDLCTGNPPMVPSNFYGYIHINDGAPSASDKIDAYVTGVSGIAASATIILDPDTGFLAYQIDVLSDVVGTPDKEGGVEGDPITFKIGSRVVATAVWHSGTNVHLDIHPPQALPGGPYSGLAGALISFIGSANDWFISDTATYDWDLDNNGSYETPNQNVSNSWATVGTKTVGLQVTDLQGGVGTATVQVNIASITLSNLSQTYDGTPKSATATTDPTGLTVTITYDGLPTAPTAAGSYAVVATISGYAGSATGTLNIAPASLSITAKNQTKVVGTTFTFLGTEFDVVGLVNGNTVTSVTLTSAGAGSGALPGNYNIVASAAVGTGLGNYAITYHDGNFLVLAKQSITLVAGWNLVSFNLVPVNTNIATVLSGISGKYDLVYGWDAAVGSDNWRKYAPAGPIYANTLNSLNETMGFWIHMTAPYTLDVAGNVPTTTLISLSTTAGGWNLVAYPSYVSRSLPTALSDHGVGTDFSLVYAYHANEILDPWKLFDRAAPAWSNDLTNLAPGWGYWVKVSANHDWSVKYLAD